MPTNLRYCTISHAVDTSGKSYQQIQTSRAIAPPLRELETANQVDTRSNPCQLKNKVEQDNQKNLQPKTAIRLTILQVFEHTRQLKRVVFFLFFSTKTKKAKHHAWLFLVHLFCRLISNLFKDN